MGKPGQVGLNANVDFNNSPTTCEQVYNFLVDGYKESSTTCKSAQVRLAEDCCRDQDKLSPSEEPAFGEGVSNDGTEGPSVGQGSVTARNQRKNPRAKL